VLPAAFRYMNDLLAAAERAAEIKLDAKGLRATLEHLNGLIDELRESLDTLRAHNAELGGEDVHSKAYHMRDNIVPAMGAVRSAVDRLEKIVPDDMWPLPTYRDMLFVK
jgi:glutamine synthetase